MMGYSKEDVRVTFKDGSIIVVKIISGMQYRKSLPTQNLINDSEQVHDVNHSIPVGIGVNWGGRGVLETI